MADFATKAKVFTQEMKRRGKPEGQIKNFLRRKFVERTGLDQASESRSEVPGADQLQLGGASILPTAARISQRFGNFNPKLEIFSKGVNTGTDFAVKRGTPITLPEGVWQVMESFSGAKEGNRGINKGYGNSIVVRNEETGETLRFSHLSRVSVGKGQRLRGGVVIAKTGSTGNSTGPHLDLEFRDSRGQLRDILSSRYGVTA